MSAGGVQVELYGSMVPPAPHLPRLLPRFCWQSTHSSANGSAFKRSVGLPPHQYQLLRRIERAKTLLADPDRSVTVIALECGFSLPGSFATAFRKTTGITPSAFRRALQ